MRLETYLKESAGNIDSQLFDFLQDWQEHTLSISSHLQYPVASFLESQKGGKRIRGALIGLAYEMFAEEKPTDDIYKIAAAYELFQTAILIHDDVIDNSVARRGRPTVHQQLGGNKTGESQAICLGDIGFFLAYQLILSTQIEPEIKQAVLLTFSQTMIDTGVGELLDVIIPGIQEIEEKDVMMVNLLKTAHYTFVGPLTIGAILARETKNTELLKELGINLGIAFQLQDDILGIFGNEKETGKSVASDSQEGKVTLLYLLAVKYADSQQRNRLKKNYGKKGLTPQDLTSIKKIFKETGALEKVQQSAKEYSLEAKNNIGNIDGKEYYKNLLSELVEFVIKRHK